MIREVTGGSRIWQGCCVATRACIKSGGSGSGSGACISKPRAGRRVNAQARNAACGFIDHGYRKSRSEFRCPQMGEVIARATAIAVATMDGRVRYFTDRVPRWHRVKTLFA